jgi:integrase
MEFYIQKRRKEGASEGYIGTELRLLKTMLKDAVENGILPKHPLQGFKTMDSPPRDRVITPEEQAKIEKVAHPEAKRFLHFQLLTGIRLDESCSITPSVDINWDRHEFRVYGKGRGKKKVRWVPLIQDYEADLKAIVTEQLALTGKDRLWTRSADAMRELLYRQCIKANVKKFGPHTCRHTFATRYLENGGRLWVLSAILGHSTVEITKKVYGHVQPRELGKLSEGVDLGVRYSGVEGGK